MTPTNITKAMFALYHIAAKHNIKLTIYNKRLNESDIVVLMCEAEDGRKSSQAVSLNALRDSTYPDLVVEMLNGTIDILEY